MLGTIVNCVAVIVGSLLGLLFAKKITGSFSEIIITAAGVVTLIIGFQMAFETEHIIYVALSLILGGLLGTALDIDEKIVMFGHFLEKKFMNKGPSNEPSLPKDSSKFAYAFLNASVLFGVGAMSIVGSFKAGTSHDYTILYTKSVLDGCMAIVFASTMGIGTAFSALSLFVYQGALTLLSHWLYPFVSDAMVIELTGLGGALIVMIGINMLDFKKIKIANFLPALLVIILFMFVDSFFSKFIATFI